MNDDMSIHPRGSIVLYQADGRNVPVEVTYYEETYWLTQQKMGELFDVTKQSISYHLKNIFDSGELDRQSVVKEFLTTASDGKNYSVAFYNLDAIIAVGYRVNSIQATRFRQWATQTLREYIVKGFVLNDDMLKNGRPYGADYFKELLQRVRDIRASEKRFYEQICEIFQEISVDYDKNSPIVRNFYSEVQNRFHYAVHGHTAAEVIDQRADATKPHMGLTTWKGAPDGRIHSSDTVVAKNYLSEDELNRLNRLSSGFLDMIESRIENMQTTTMRQCIDLVNQYVQLTGGPILEGKGTRSHKQAERKAKEEWRKFNATDPSQLSDFEKFVRRVEGGE